MTRWASNLTIIPSDSSRISKMFWKSFRFSTSANYSCAALEFIQRDSFLQAIYPMYDLEIPKISSTYKSEVHSNLCVTPISIGIYGICSLVKVLFPAYLDLEQLNFLYGNNSYILYHICIYHISWVIDNAMTTKNTQVGVLLVSSITKEE